jgi:hypothetical protein
MCRESAHVILSKAKNLGLTTREILRCAQDDTLMGMTPGSANISHQLHKHQSTGLAT